MPQSVSCPYGNVKATGKTILVADEYCPQGTLMCFVNTLCEPDKTDFTPSDTIYYSSHAISAVGVLTKFNYTKFEINANAKLDLSLMSLPSIVKEFTVSPFSQITLTLPKQWSPSLTKISLDSCSLNEIPSNLPSNLTDLSLSHNSIKEITNLPSTLSYLSLNNNNIKEMANLPTTLNYLNLDGNSLTSIVNLDFSKQLVSISLGNNPISTISNISFNEDLGYFGCTNCAPSNVTLTQASYDILTHLPSQTQDRTNQYGLWISNSSVLSNIASCTAIGGTVKALSPKNKNDISWQICILPSAVNEPSPLANTIQNGNSKSSGLIIGLVVGGIAVAVVVALVVFFLWKRRRAINFEDQNTALLPALPSGLRRTEQIEDGKNLGSENDGDLDMSKLLPLRLSKSQVVVTGDRPMASGAFGDVWRGQYNKEAVAIKCIRTVDAGHIQKFIDEILLMSKMKCTDIVQLIGATWRRPTDLACVVEYMDLGDLRSLLSKTTCEQFTWQQKLRSILSIVNGLQYLHSFNPPIIHRDLKSRNVLLDSKKGTKLTDFGESREMDLETLTNGVGTYQWMAPEIITGRDYSVAADVYSFGVILSEFSTHNVPYGDFINPSTNQPYNQRYVMNQVSSGKIRPTFDTNQTPEWVLTIANLCLSTKEHERPDMASVASMLPKLN